jgi:spore coat protein A, manganese oxidase
MQFRVSANAPIDTSYNPASGTPILTGGQTIKRLVNPANGTLAVGVTPNLTRELVLVEIEGPTDEPLEVLVNNSKWNGLQESTGQPIPGSMLVNGSYITELPKEGQTEVWEVVNTAADAHPIHLHGVQFQILNRQAFKTTAFFAAYAAAFPFGAFIPSYGPPKAYDPASNPLSGGKYGGNPDVRPYLQGPARPQLSFEAGWKDTAIMRSGSVTRIAVRFAPQDTPIGTTGNFSFVPNAPTDNGQFGYYVWHCHITDHEDNEMMRPSMFVPNQSAQRTYVQGVDY